MKTVVTDKEILDFDPMIHKIVKDEILQYWASGLSVYSTRNEQTIGRLGMSFEDLMQFGRLLVHKQIIWFKQNGIDPETGLPKKAKLSTLMYQYLRNKFMSLSKSHASRKSGGPVVNVEENRKALQKYIDHFERKAKLKINKEKLTKSMKCPKEVIKLIDKQASNDTLLQLAKKILIDIESVSHVSYEDIGTFAAASNTLNPEEFLSVKEEVKGRLQDYCEKRDMDLISLSDYLKRNNKITRPKFRKKGEIPLLMKLARDQGIASSQRQLAKKMGIGMTTLSNIIRGRSRGTQQFRDNLEQMFNKPFDDLMKVINEG